MLDMDQHFAVRGLVNASRERLPARLDPAVVQEPHQHERRVLGDVEGIVHFLSRHTTVDRGEGIGVYVVQSGDDLVLELEEVGLLLRGLATFREAYEDSVIGPDREYGGGLDIIGRAVENVFKGTHLVMLS